MTRRPWAPTRWPARGSRTGRSRTTPCTPTSRPATSRTGLRLVNRIGGAAESANHHPDLVLTYPHVEVTLTSHDAGGVTSRDISMARTISGFAAEEIG